MEKKTVLALLLGILTTPLFASAQQVWATSPDGKTEVIVAFNEQLNYSVKRNGDYQLLQTSIGLMLADGTSLGFRPELMAQRTRKVSQSLTTLYGTRKTVSDDYTELTIDLKDKSRVLFRIYNDAVAYRWVTAIKGSITVATEEWTIRMPQPIKGWVPDLQTYETTYTYKELGDNEAKRDLFLPLVVEGKNNVKLTFTESDLADYPSLFLRKSNDVETRLEANFQKYPKTLIKGGYNLYNMVVKEAENFIAVTNGTREFPWRIVLMTDNDAQLVGNDIVYRLAKPQASGDFAWVKPGKVVWDWWADYVIEGVDFKTGINTATYLKHIDFAAQHRIEYIIIDWKWTDRDDITLLNPDVDAPKIIDYGKQKGVRVIVWLPSYTLHRQLDQALDMVAQMGAAGVKVDFFDRDDQLTIRMYHDIAKAAASRQLLVDFHGCTKPMGLERTYPNIINYEAVLGNEVNKWDNLITPSHKVNLAFIRNLQGSMDFTPGGMRNAHKGDYMSRNTLPMVQGTRAEEMALYVVFYEPLKMCCDATSTYAKESECFTFIAQIPTVWDNTRVLSAKMGNYVVVARQSGNIWYVAGINDSSERDITLDLSFIGRKNVTVEAFTDGTNADRVATDYQHRTSSIDPSKPFAVKMTSGGGFVMKIAE